MIKMIWAMDKNWLIGKENKIPWHYKEDLIYFKEQTKGQNVLMGDKTYYSLKSYYKDRPFPYGKIYVASLDDLQLEDAILVKDIDGFLQNYHDDLFVIGGATIYKMSLKYADYLYITFINKEYDGDTYFPHFNLNDYKLISQNDLNELSFRIYERK